MEKLFNMYTADSVRECIVHHHDDERYVPANLPEPGLVNIKPVGGLLDMYFDGGPRLVRNRH